MVHLPTFTSPMDPMGKESPSKITIRTFAACFFPLNGYDGRCPIRKVPQVDNLSHFSIPIFQLLGGQ